MLNFKPQGDNNHINCNNPENIFVTIDAAKLAAAKAGTYDVSLNLATSDLLSSSPRLANTYR